MLRGRKSLVIFDLDGTLVDSVPDIAVALNAALVELNYPSVSMEQVRHWVGNGAGALCSRAIARDNAGTTDPDATQRLLQRFLTRYADRACVDSRCYESADIVLSALAAKNFRLACVSNKPALHTRLLLDALGLRVRFGLVLGGDSLPYRKPRPEPIQACLTYFDVPPQAALVIGDSANDIEAARAADVDSVAVTYGYNQGRDVHTLGANVVIDSLARLPHLLESSL